jgi:signal transduction histidine kinase
VHIALKTEGAEAVVCVKDQGPGIAPSDQERIFGQFERAEATSAVPGLGLGLFISRQIAQAHGGSLTVRSAPGAGAEFQLRLPLAAAA